MVRLWAPAAPYEIGLRRVNTSRGQTERLEGRSRIGVGSHAPQKVRSMYLYVAPWIGLWIAASVCAKGSATYAHQLWETLTVLSQHHFNRSFT